MELKKLSEEQEEQLIDDENYRLAHKYMDLYLDGLIDENKTRRENDYLTKKLDQMIDAMRDMQGEIAEIKEQNNALVEGFRFLDFTRLTIGIGGNPPALDSGNEEVDAILSSIGYRKKGADALSGSIEQHPAQQDVYRLPDEAAAEHSAQTATQSPAPKRRERPNFSSGSEFRGGARKSTYRLSDDEQFREMFSQENRYPFIPEQPEPAQRVAAAPPQASQAEQAEQAEQQPQPRQEAQPTSPPAVAAQPAKKKKSPLGIISNILFYLCLVMLIVGSVTFAQSTDTEKSLFGFRYYYIKTASMIPVYPVGSVVITKVTAPEDIQVGDDITIYVGDGRSDTYLTHRVVEITKDQAGELAFRTKGVNNKSNDPTPFNSKLVVGRVVFCIPVLGTVMTFVRSQLWLVIGIFILLLALSFMLRLLFTKEQPQPGVAAQPQQPPKEKKRRSRMKKQAVATQAAGVYTGDAQMPQEDEQQADEQSMK